MSVTAGRPSGRDVAGQDVAGRDVAGGDGPPGPAQDSPPARRRWADLALGARLSVAGGRSERLRTTLTAVGVSLGVAFLLVAAAIPTVQDRQLERWTARELPGSDGSLAAADTTMIAQTFETWCRDRTVQGVLLDPDGTRPPLPPGVTALPQPGEMIVSPALAEFLAGRDGPRLAPRLPYRQVGTIGEAGLQGPHELYFYAGAELDAELEAGGPGALFTTNFRPVRIDHFGMEVIEGPASDSGVVSVEGPPSGLIRIFSLLCVVVLLLPVGMLTVAATRFGGGARDGQLAAVRLLGADARTARWIAVGGALPGAVLGCAAGAALFVTGRGAAGYLALIGTSVFASDVWPGPLFVAAVLFAVPAAAVAVALVALRRVVAEPLGVARRVGAGRRRLWWRLPVLAAGVASLLTLPEGLGWSGGSRDDVQLVAGAVLTLLGVAALTPWLVEKVVRRLPGGPLGWTFAVRRLQLGGGVTVRTVAAVSVTIAGVVALQMLFSAADREYLAGVDPARDRDLLAVEVPATAATADGLTRVLSAAHGVRSVHAYSTSSVSWGQSVGGDQAFDWGAFTPLVVGDCPTLKELLIVTDCVDGDVFAAPVTTRSVVGVDQLTDPDVVIHAGGDPLIPGAGVTVTVAAPGDPRWTVPAIMRVATVRSGALLGTADSLLGSLFVTPGALAGDLRPASAVTGIVRIDLADPDAADNVANAIAGVAPLRSPSGALLGDDSAYAPVRTAMDLVIVALFGAVGAGLVITVVEESRERRRALAVLSAVGARRRTVAGWVLWQTAIPMILGVPLALGAGLGLGTALLRVAGVAPTVPWTNIAVVCATAFAVVLVTTAASLPALGRLMRPDGLRVG